eukprot:364560-Chlamydomonas_euryale.AAC.10
MTASFTRRVVVTGGSRGGLGYEAARKLVAAGHHVLLTFRDAGKAEAAISSLRREMPQPTTAGEALGLAGEERLSWVRLDLDSLDSVRQAGAEITAKWPYIDALLVCVEASAAAQGATLTHCRTSARMHCVGDEWLAARAGTHASTKGGDCAPCGLRSLPTRAHPCLAALHDQSILVCCKRTQATGARRYCLQPPSPTFPTEGRLWKAGARLHVSPRMASSQPIRKYHCMKTLRKYHCMKTLGKYHCLNSPVVSLDETLCALQWEVSPGNVPGKTACSARMAGSDCGGCAQTRVSPAPNLDGTDYSAWSQARIRGVKPGGQRQLSIHCPRPTHTCYECAQVSERLLCLYEPPCWEICRLLAALMGCIAPPGALVERIIPHGSSI